MFDYQGISMGQFPGGSPKFKTMGSILNDDQDLGVPPQNGKLRINGSITH